jgi:hypothetical protein
MATAREVVRERTASVIEAVSTMVALTCWGVVLVEERRSGAHVASEPELLVRAIGYAVARTSKGSCCVSSC